jgi:hypothetical protein
MLVTVPHGKHGCWTKRSTPHADGPCSPPILHCHLEADVLSLSVTVQPQYEPLTLARKLLQVLLQVALVLHSTDIPHMMFWASC